MKLKIYEALGGDKKQREYGKGNSGQVESTRTMAPPKSVGEGQPYLVLGQRNKLLYFRKCLGSFFRSELETVRLMEQTRSEHLSAAMILSSSSGEG